MFAVVYIPDFSLQSALRSEPELKLQAVALLDPALPKPCVIQLTTAARSHGVCEGLTASQAMARCGNLIIKNRSPAREQVVTDILLQTAYAFSPNIEDTAPGVCTLDLKGLGLESGESVRVWASDIREALAQCGLECRIGVAATPALAWLAARMAEPVVVLQEWDDSIGTLSFRELRSSRREEAPTHSAGEIQSLLTSAATNKHVENDAPHLESFPIAALEPPPEILAVLERWGIRTIGGLLALGKDRVAERLGPAAVELFDRVSPESLRPLKLVVPPAEFIEQMDFEDEIETVEPLLFVLRRFVEQLSRRLELIYLVVGGLQLRLGLASGARHERSLKVPAATGSVETLFRMLQTHLETVRTDSPIVSLRLEAEPGKPETHQFGLFETTLRDPNQFGETLARLTALCGPDRVGSPVPAATHRPDAFRMQAPEFGKSGRTGKPASRSILQSTSQSNTGPVLRRFRPAVAAQVEVREQRPVLFRSAVFNGVIARSRGPFLSSGDWWDANRWAREEWDVQTGDGTLCRIFKSADGWFVEGVYD